MTNVLSGSGMSASAATIEHALTETMATVRADSVFGRPVERGGTTVIPCAEIAVGMGLGGGGGSGPVSQSQGTGEAAAVQGTAGGEGYGGGGGGRGRPVAVIVVTADGVRVQPVLDITKLALAGLTTSAFMAFWLARLASGARGGRAKAQSFGRLARTLRS